MKKNTEKIKNSGQVEEKVKYGWYLKHVMLFLILIGSSGILMMVVSSLLEDFLRIILFSVGLGIALLLLWPGIGVLAMNLLTDKNMAHPTINLPEIVTLESPTILDIGCGTGRVAIGMAKNLKNGGKVYGIDIFDRSLSNNALETVKRNARLENVDNKTTFQHGSALEIPHEDDFFDIVNISYVIHEIPDKSQVLREIARVLKQDGTLYITELQRKSFSTLLLMGLMCLTCKSKEYWQDLLRKNNFKEFEVFDKGPIFVCAAHL